LGQTIADNETNPHKPGQADVLKKKREHHDVAAKKKGNPQDTRCPIIKTAEPLEKKGRKDRRLKLEE